MHTQFINSFREIQAACSRFYVRVLIEVDLTLPQYTLLTLLAKTEAMTMTEASEKLHITKPAVTHLVDQLEKKKCIKRVESTEDRRVYQLQVTARGKEIVRQTQSRILDFLLKTFEKFKTSEREVISRFYGLLSETIEQELVRGDSHE